MEQEIEDCGIRIAEVGRTRPRAASRKSFQGSVVQCSWKRPRLSLKRELPDTNGLAIAGEGASLVERISAGELDAVQQGDKGRGLEPFDPDSDDAWLRRIRSNHQGVKICVEGHDDSVRLARFLDDLLIGRISHAKLGYMDRIISK